MVTYVDPTAFCLREGRWCVPGAFDRGTTDDAAVTKPVLLGRFSDIVFGAPPSAT